MRFFNFSTTSTEMFPILRKTQRKLVYIYIILHLKYLLSLPVLNKLELSGQICDKFTSIKAYENPSSWSPVAP